jgi:hypothetical protein
MKLRFPAVDAMRCPGWHGVWLVLFVSLSVGVLVLTAY